jgi:hypothetical protein
MLSEVTLYTPAGDQSNAPHVQLAGWIEMPRNAEILNTHTLKEIVVFQNPSAVNMFNVIKYGRCFLKVLEYTSNMSICRHEVEGEPCPDHIAGIMSISAGVSV